jgi:hypothetical protein
MCVLERDLLECTVITSYKFSEEHVTKEDNIKGVYIKNTACPTKLVTYTGQLKEMPVYDCMVMP